MRSALEKREPETSSDGGAGATRCANCGFPNPWRFRFCGQCGALLGRPADHSASPPGERRQLTVMYCDLVGSTALSARLDPEELRQVIRAYQEFCTGVIDRFGGHVSQYQGDGLLVYFGFPQAHEDDAHRAVRTGLEIVRGVRSLGSRVQRGGSEPLAVRVGIHTGIVVVDEIGVGAKVARLALGEAPNVAARLQALGEPDSVAITAATAQLLRGAFECRDLGLHPLKGIPTPTRVFRVVEERNIHGPFDAASTMHLTALVGRDQEVDVLRRYWAQARDRRGHAVVLTGEPGIGKTRLTQMIKEDVARGGGICLECHCSPFHQNSALYPVVDLVERVLGFERDDDSQEKLAKLESALAGYPVSLPDIMPPFASLLSLQPPPHYPSPALGPAALKQKTMDAVLGLLQAMTAAGAILVIVENLQWVDPSTLEILTLLVDRIPMTPILAVFTCRPEFRPPWGSSPHLTQIALSRLSRGETEILIERVAGGKALPPEVLDQVATKTDGIPLFAEELTKMVLESSLLRERESRYELPRPLPPLAIPTTLHDSLMARLDRLPAGRAVTQLAATLGRTFSYELLRSVSPLDAGALREDLEVLVEAGLLYRNGLPPRATYTFKHALIQDAAYQSLLRSTRQMYHHQIAGALAEHFPEVAETQPELLAHHLTAAGLNAEAVGFWTRAGARALRRFANVEAIAHLSRGLDLLDTLPESPGRAQQELGLQISLAVPLIATRGYAAVEVEKTCLRARELCQQLGQTPQLFPVLWALWQFHVVRAEFRTAHELGDQLLSLAGSDPIFLLLAHEALGVTLFFMGELAPARGHLERTMALYDSAEHRSLAYSYTQDPDVAARSYAGIVLWALGYPDQALKRSREALDRARELAHPFSQVFALNLWNWLLVLRREGRPAGTPIDAAIRLSGEQRFALGLAMATVLHGWTLVQDGREADGTAELRRGLADWRATGAKLLEPFYLAMLGEAAGRAGHVGEGLAFVNEAQTLANSTGERWYEAELHRLRGELLLEQAVPDEHGAEAAFRRALHVARRQGARALALRAAMSLGRLLHKRGGQDAARRVLIATHGSFTEGFDVPDLREARRWLDRLCPPDAMLNPGGGRALIGGRGSQ